MPATRLIFGCQSITGGSSLGASLRVLHGAIDCGIKRFDVAPSYGMGTAENVLGRAIRNQTELRISTKVGIEPPRFGNLLAIAREPYRRAQQLFGRTPPYASRKAAEFGGPTHARAVDVELSLRRSKAALRTDVIDAWLAHEGLTPECMAAFVAIGNRERTAGLLSALGLSGKSEAIMSNAGALPTHGAVVQCSIIEAQKFQTASELRLFGVVGCLAPILQKLASDRPAYAEALADGFGTSNLSDRQVFVACVAAARALAPAASILVSSGKVETIRATVKALSVNALSDWAHRYADIHGSEIWPKNLPGGEEN